MKEAILNFANQFDFKPEVVNQEKLKKTDKFVVCGMGGSHLAADLIWRWNRSFDLLIHSNYGLPALSELDKKERLLIFSSYSGNTEEILDGYEQAKKEGYNMAVVSAGGKLIEMAENDGVPFVKIPSIGIQPRVATGFSMLGLFKLMGLEDAIDSLGKMSENIKPGGFEEKGLELAEKLKNYVPVIYSSELNKPIANNWKIKFNETGKIPAFYNTLPELNHNEMTGFDVVESSAHLSKQFYFIFLKDEEDHPKVQKRMEVMQKLYQDRGLQVEVVSLTGDSVFEKIFRALIIADWAALKVADMYGLESEQVPMVEEFKKAISS